MKPEVKKLWVDALRSGQYAQTRGALHRLSDIGAGDKWKEGYCCLGVLCDLAVKSGVKVNSTKNNLLEFFDDENGILPKSVMDWAGLEGHTVHVRNNEESLAEINDNGSTFNQIADIIENNL